MANTGTVWAFDLGKGSIGDPSRRRISAARAVRLNDEFLHKAPSLFPTGIGKDKTGEGVPAGFVLETLLNRCIRMADREPVCVI